MCASKQRVLRTLLLSMNRNFNTRNSRFRPWRAALTQASNLSGWDSSVTRPDSRLVEEIVKDVSNKLYTLSSSSDFPGLIGLDERIERLKLLFCLGISDFRIIGIWGMGGSGKTTIAESVFKVIASDQFEAFCFIANVREESEKCGGLIRLREEVLSKVLDEENLKLGNLSIPLNIKSRLNRKKFFIVLDDVNYFRQLELLAGGLDQFGPGSRILITTRDRQVLRNCGVSDPNIYEVEGFNHHEALQIFCSYAFKQNHPSKDLMILSNNVVNYAKGNPLTLKVLGSLLYRKSKREWESAFDKLQRIFISEIHDVLKISYDRLDDEEKDVFLDIACFFKGKYVDYVATILGDCYFSLGVLIDKSLVTISDNKIQMHDLLQEMGWEIVRKESPSKLGKRSRLWNHKDVFAVLERNSGTDAVKGIFLDMSKIKDIDLNSEFLQRMWNLRYLKFYSKILFFEDSKVHLPDGLNYLPTELRYLHWHGYPLKALPSSFSPENLVELDLSFSNAEQLWEGTKSAPNLKWLNFSHSRHLTRIPDFSDSPCLEVIVLEYCKSIVDIRSTIQHLNNLLYLSLKGCKSLRRFPSNIHFESFITLDLSDCDNLPEFPRISGNVVAVYLHGTAIEEIPTSIESLTKLSILTLWNCTRLKHISTSICNLKSLDRLDLHDCSKLECFPEILETMDQLEDIDLSRTAIKELPPTIEHLNGLLTLSLVGCKNLETLPSSISNLTSLIELDLSNCSKLEHLPENLGNLQSLEYLSVKGALLSQLPSFMIGLKKLEILECSGCRGLAFPPISSVLCPLRELYLNDCNLTEISEDIDCLSALEVLELCENDFELLPKSIKQLPMLRQLLLNDCNMLQSLTELPLGLQHFEAMNCNQLELLPDASEFSELVTQSCMNGDSFFVELVFIFTNCVKLNRKTFCNVRAVSLLIIQHMAMSSLICHEKGYEKSVAISVCLPGSEIPDWFCYQSSGSLLVIQPPLQPCKSKFMGFALCAVIAFEEYYHDDPIALYVSYFCKFETIDGNIGDFFGNLVVGHNKFIDADHVVLGYHPCSDVELLRGASFEFCTRDPYWMPIKGCKVKHCGVCPIYAEPKMSQQKIFASGETLEEEYSQSKSRKFHDEADTSGRSDEDEMEPCSKRICSETN